MGAFIEFSFLEVVHPAMTHRVNLVRGIEYLMVGECTLACHAVLGGQGVSKCV